MEQAQILFPELAEPAVPAAQSAPPQAPRAADVLRFRPRQARASATRLSGDGLAVRLKHDVERQVAHRRRMLAHLQSQARVAGRE